MWVYEFHWRPTIWEDMTQRETEIIDRHDRYVDSLYVEGRVVLAGVVEAPPRGVVFYNATDEDEARAIMEKDPCFAAGIVEVTLHAFSDGYIGAGSGYNHRRDQAADS